MTAPKLHPNTVYLRAAMAKAGITCLQAATLVKRKRNTFAKYSTEQDGRIIGNDLLEELDKALCAGRHRQFQPKLRFLDQAAPPPAATTIDPRVLRAFETIGDHIGPNLAAAIDRALVTLP